MGENRLTDLVLLMVHHDIDVSTENIFKRFDSTGNRHLKLQLAIISYNMHINYTQLHTYMPLCYHSCSTKY